MFNSPLLFADIASVAILDGCALAVIFDSTTPSHPQPSLAAVAANTRTETNAQRMDAIQLSKSLVEGRERRKLYKSPSPEEADAVHEGGAEEPGMMMRLADGTEKAQKERLDVSAYATTPQQVSQLQYVNELAGGSGTRGHMR